MYRINTHLNSADSQFYLRRQEYSLNRIQNKIASNERIKDLRDDPTGAATATRLDSFLHRHNHYYDNTQFALDTYRFTEGKMREAVDVIQRVREIAVQGANGTYSADQRAILAGEVNELLNELVSIGNATDADGKALFGGTATDINPFRVEYGNVDGAVGQHVTSVVYQGNINTRSAEISENTSIPLDFAGNRIFWAQNQQIFSQVDATAYRALEPSIVSIDGIDIAITPGDNVGSIIQKINTQVPAVEASLDPIRNSLVISTTEPHQLTFGETGTVLQDLGIYDPTNGATGLNADADNFGASLYDNVITLRDALYANDAQSSNSQLIGIDAAANTLLINLADVGARQTRVEFTGNRLLQDITELTEQTDTLLAPDITQAIIQLHEQENSHRAALSIASRVIPQTLLDFIR